MAPLFLHLSRPVPPGDHVRSSPTEEVITYVWLLECPFTSLLALNPRGKESSKETLPLSFHNFTKLVHSVPWLCLLALPVSFTSYAPSRFWSILSEHFTFEMLSMVSAEPSFDPLNGRFNDPP